MHLHHVSRFARELRRIPVAKPQASLAQRTMLFCPGSALLSDASFCADELTTTWPACVVQCGGYFS